MSSEKIMGLGNLRSDILNLGNYNASLRAEISRLEWSNSNLSQQVTNVRGAHERAQQRYLSRSQSSQITIDRLCVDLFDAQERLRNLEDAYSLSQIEANELRETLRRVRRQ